MTKGQILLWSGFYLVGLWIVIRLTRPGGRRLLGALAGGAVVGAASPWLIAAGEAFGWWRVPMPRSAGFALLFCLGFAISVAPIYLVTWRVARRFGARGLLACVAAAALIGPPRDCLYAARFPAWMTFGKGVAPLLGDAAAYAVIVALGHAVMRAIAGAAKGDAPRSTPG